MAPIIPKDMRGFRFAKAVPFELNDALIDIMLPNLFQRAILENRDLAATNIDASDIEGPIITMARSERLEGFDDADARVALEKLVKSSLITIGYRGTGRKESDKQIEGIVPYSIASFKTGLPKSRTRLRNIDQFTYYLLLVEFDQDPKKVSAFLVDVFGEGVEVLGHPKATFVRQEHSGESLDVLTDLSISYLEGLPSVKPQEKPKDRQIAQPLPGFQSRFGKDLYRFLWSYRDRVPTSMLIDQVVTLISFEIALFTIKLLDVIPQLSSNPAVLPAVMTRDDDFASDPELYLDMIGEPRGISRTMASTCVRRDLGSIDPFIRSILRLRYLDGMLSTMYRNPKLRPLFAEMPDSSNTPQYLQALLTLEDDPRIQAHLNASAGHDFHRILEANSVPGSEIEGDSDRSPVGLGVDISDDQNLSIDAQVVDLLFNSQVTKTRSSIAKWILSVGGVNTTYGLINGRSDRRSWAYAPSNDLLTVLIQLRAIDYKGWNPKKGAKPAPFSVPEFLEWLEGRFGIIVDRPPAGLGFDGPEHMAAARDNLKAMLRRLRQMGIFEDQSDDFAVQTLTPPYVDSTSDLQPAHQK